MRPHVVQRVGHLFHRAGRVSPVDQLRHFTGTPTGSGSFIQYALHVRAFSLEHAMDIIPDHIREEKTGRPRGLQGPCAGCVGSALPERARGAAHRQAFAARHRC